MVVGSSEYCAERRFAGARLTRLTRLNHHRRQHPIDRADMEMHSCHGDALAQFVIHLLLNF